MATADEERFTLEWSEVRFYRATVPRSELSEALGGKDPAIVIPLGDPSDYGELFGVLISDLETRGSLVEVDDISVRKIKRA